MDYNFHNRILLFDAHRKHILIILVIDSQNFRKFQELFSEFQRDDNKKSEKNIKQTTDKKVEFQQDSISWAEVITN